MSGCRRRWRVQRGGITTKDTKDHQDHQERRKPGWPGVLGVRRLPWCSWWP